MKKSIIALTITFACLLLSGCSNGRPQDTDSEQGSISWNESSTTNESPQSKPDGEPTFLIGADGQPIYASEITEVTTGEFGEEVISVEQLDENSFFSVTCKGFAYVHDSRIRAFAAEDPDKFEDGIYTGEELSPSPEYRRLRVGDKVGTLTVRDAETVFYRVGELSERGSYLGGASVYFDGEITITGYLSIYENPLYQDGMVRLMPSEGSLPQMFYGYAEGVGVSHSPEPGEGYYSETALFNLGYLMGINADMSGFEVGDTNVKVRAVIGSVRAGGGLYPMYFGNLISIEKCD